MTFIDTHQETPRDVGVTVAIERLKSAASSYGADAEYGSDIKARRAFEKMKRAELVLNLSIAKAIRDAELRMRERCYEVAHHIYMERVLNQPIVDAAGGDVHAAHAKAIEALRIRDAIRRLEPEGGK